MDAIHNEGFDAALTQIDHIDHLPERKRRELARILQIVFAEVAAHQSTKLSGKGRGGRILKVILYGSYARGDWVEDRLSGYRSDYDLLIVVDTKSFAEDDELWLALDERLIQEQIAHRIKTPVLAVVHSLHDVNDQLSRGRPFFVDIARDGRILYEEPGHPLAQARPLSAAEKRAEAQGHFDQWLQLSKDALAFAEFGVATEKLRDGAFMLHQATERAYHCLLLTLTLYSPKSHRIKVLRSSAEEIDSRLVAAWPRDKRLARKNFELLSRAYVEARYSAKYQITHEELQWLLDRVRVLQTLAEAVCTERLAVLQ